MVNPLPFNSPKPPPGLAVIHCPGCGRRATVGAVVCPRCRDFLPQSIRDDLDAAEAHPALMPAVLPAVLLAVSVPTVRTERAGMRPLLGPRPTLGRH